MREFLIEAVKTGWNFGYSGWLRKYFATFVADHLGTGESPRPENPEIMRQNDAIPTHTTETLLPVVFVPMVPGLPKEGFVDKQMTVEKFGRK